jgi:hypothetical protein
MEVFWFTVGQEYPGYLFNLYQSSTLVIAYLIKKQKMNFINALKLVKSKRYQICPNLGFELQLKSYYRLIN